MRRTTSPRLLCLLAVLLAIVLAMAGAARTAASHQPPYDPRPLLQAAAPEKPEPFTFAVFGDSYANPPLAGLLKMVAAHSPDFAVTTGDMVSDGGSASAWRKLSDRAGWFLTSVPTWPVIGNHELKDRQKGLEAFRRFYDLPAAGYSFRFRGAKFIVLDYEAAPAPADQVAFLRQQLADRDEYKHVFVFRHSPFYTIGMKSKAEVPNTPTALTELFRERHVTAVFCGHDHGYYRTRREGVAHVTSGSAGAGVYPLLRLKERLPDDAYMGVRRAGAVYLVHSPGLIDRAVPMDSTSSDKWVFSVFVHVNGSHVTAETVSVTGQVWDRFELP